MPFCTAVSISTDKLTGFLLAGCLGLLSGIGILGGAYPAFGLSAFRPATVLKCGPAQGFGSRFIRQGLVVLQFASLIVLIIATSVIYRQTEFAMNEGLGFDKKQIFFVWNCDPAFVGEMAKLSGVKDVACTSNYALETGRVEMWRGGC